MNTMEKFALKYKELRKRYKKVMANSKKWIAYSREARNKLKRTRKIVQALDKFIREKRVTGTTSKDYKLVRIYSAQWREKK